MKRHLNLAPPFVAHAPADEPFFEELTAFLEVGCDAVHFTPDTAVKPGDDLISVAETGRGAADILVLPLSPASNPARWEVERWKPFLSARASGADAHIASLVLEECTFPTLLRRGLQFFEASVDRLAAMRQLKRWGT